MRAYAHTRPTRPTDRTDSDSAAAATAASSKAAHERTTSTRICGLGLDDTRPCAAVISRPNVERATHRRCAPRLFTHTQQHSHSTAKKLRSSTHYTVNGKKYVVSRDRAHSTRKHFEDTRSEKHNTKRPTSTPACSRNNILWIHCERYTGPKTAQPWILSSDCQPHPRPHGDHRLFAGSQHQRSRSDPTL